MNEGQPCRKNPVKEKSTRGFGTWDLPVELPGTLTTPQQCSNERANLVRPDQGTLVLPEVISVEVCNVLGFHPTLAIATITLTLGKTEH